MGHPASETQPRVAAIVPAFNEEETLVDVVTVLKSTGTIDEVLVVSDGSTDETVRISRSLGVKTIHLHQNYGKAMAMAIGVAHTDAPVLVFVDGDILNLSEYLLGQLIEPVVSGRSEMCSTAQIAVRLARGVDGVVSVTDTLSWRFDDTSTRSVPPMFDP
jgi:glycosyltransferase involved in cell wall biosynthesis